MSPGQCDRQCLVLTLSSTCSRPHPRIVNFYGTVTTNAESFDLVIEYCEDGDLRNLLDTKETEISDEQKLQIVMDVAQVE